MYFAQIFTLKKFLWQIQYTDGFIIKIKVDFKETIPVLKRLKNGKLPQVVKLPEQQRQMANGS